MPDIFLYQEQFNLSNIILRDPTSLGFQTYNYTTIGGALNGGHSLRANGLIFIGSSGAIAGGLFKQNIGYKNTCDGGMISGGLSLEAFGYEYFAVGGSVENGEVRQNIGFLKIAAGGAMGGCKTTPLFYGEKCLANAGLLFGDKTVSIMLDQYTKVSGRSYPYVGSENLKFPYGVRD